MLGEIMYRHPHVLSLLGVRSEGGEARLLNNTGRISCGYSLGEEWDQLRLWESR